MTPRDSTSSPSVSIPAHEVAARPAPGVPPTPVSRISPSAGGNHLGGRHDSPPI